MKKNIYNDLAYFLLNFAKIKITIPKRKLFFKDTYCLLFL